MSRSAIISALFGALAAAFMAIPANALPASPSKLVTENVVGSVQTVAHRRGYRRGHGSGVRLFFGGRRHGGDWGNDGRRQHEGRAYRGSGGRYGRGMGHGGRY